MLVTHADIHIDDTCTLFIKLHGRALKYCTHITCLYHTSVWLHDNDINSQSN